ncbi:hypothetical protein AGMMS49573_00230 [Endomicrobiia bacterium]|nr:hypothetical protein AGMMS49573_00230 [Endomicrobiia bacterium]
MLTASGLSDKALNYFTEKDKNKAILSLIKNFLEPADDFAIEENLKALSWINSKGKRRILVFNLNIPVVRNNVDICLFKSDACFYKYGNIADEPKNIDFICCSDD